MKKILSGITIILIAIINFSGCSSDSAKKENSNPEEKGALVEIQNLTSSEYIDYLSVMGITKPLKKSNLSFQEGGVIKTFRRTKGSFVKEGDTIAVMDNEIIKSGLNALKAQHDLAKLTYDKQSVIFKENVNSEFEFLQSKYQYEQVKANYEQAVSRFGKTFICAPFAGIIVDKYLEVGEFAAAGMPIVDLMEIRRIKVEAGIPERYALVVKKGMNVLIKFKDNTSPDRQGVISFVSSTVNTANRTFNIEIEVENTSLSLKPEMIVEVLVQNKKYDNVVTIPDEIIRKEENGYTVFVAKDGKAVKKNIEIIGRFGNKVAVKSGLSVDEKLIVVGYHDLIEDEKITVVN